MDKRRVCWISAVLMLLVVQAGFGANLNLIGHWKFDDGAGMTAVDSSGGGHDGTLENGGGMTWGPGMIRGALNFDGVGYVDVPAEVWSSVSTQLTIAFWTFGSEGLPNNWGFFAGNASEERLVSCHIPWDGSVYFDTATGWERINKVAQASEYQGQWRHWTFVKNADAGDKKIYLDGELWHSGSGFTDPIEGVTVFRIGAGDNAAFPYVGMLDDFQLYNVELTEDQIKSAMRGVGAEMAADPAPEDGQSDVPREVVLSWTAGEFAATHDVYLGTVWDDVNNANRAEGLDVFVSQSQAAVTYDPGRLEFGRTYYWRVDEVNAAPSNTIFKGDVWSFTVEPFAYPVANVIATSNATSDPENGPEKIVDGSGLNAAGQHSIDGADMWLGVPGADPVTLQFEFDGVYKLHEMQVWNYNVMFELMLGFGLKNVTVEYSANGTDWTVLGDVQFAQATATADYTANTTVDFAGAAVKYVKLTVNSGWGMLGQFGLSEIHFMYIPVAAREPQPTDGRTGVSPGGVLGWRAGREAASHEVYVDADEAAVADGAALAGTVADASYPLGGLGLELDSTYYWKVNEVNEAEAVSTWEGKVWSFTTQEFVVVDDFESYGEPLGNRIYEFWIDGWENGTSSTVGHLAAPFVEEDIVHGGGQSMPLFYDNAAVTVAEAEYTFAAAQDWTAMGIQSLALYFHGAPDNTGELYLAINDIRVDYGGDASDIRRPQWQPWNVDLSAVGVNLSNVTKLTIGVGGPGAVGVVYVDDIRLYPQAVEMITPVEPDPANLVLHYTFDEGSGAVAGDASGSGNTGTVNGNPEWVAGVSGSALAFDGARVYVGTDQSLLSDLAEFTIACWLKGDLSLGNRSGLIGQNDCIEYGVVGANTIQIWSNDEGVDLTWPYAAAADWHHIVAVGDGQSVTIYLDGKSAVSGGTAIEEVYGTSTYPVNIGGGGIFDATGNWFTGQIDEVRIYQRALSAAEVAGLAGLTEPIYKPL